MIQRIPTILAGVATSIFTLLVSTGCRENQTPTPIVNNGYLSTLDADNLCHVITNPELDEILLTNYEGFIVSFNPTMHLPNWVAWTITREHLENSTVTRTDNFRPDESVAGCATLADYRGSGYDRGHMAPAADMKWSAKAMDDACFLTNICPQLHDLNDGAWKNLEEKCRKNALSDSVLVVIAGPVLTKGFTKFIGGTPVPVPPSYFKVIISPWKKSGPEGIGFIMPNSYVEGGMQTCVFSIDEVESLTGHDFFSILPDDIEKAIETQKDFNRFSSGY